ncbi:MAG: PAS domain-containing sensor histidine kinase [bacterium]
MNKPDSIGKLYFMDFCSRFNLSAMILKKDGLIDYISPGMTALSGYSLANLSTVSAMLTKFFTDQAIRNTAEKFFKDSQDKKYIKKSFSFILNLKCKNDEQKEVRFTLFSSVDESVYVFTEEIQIAKSSEKTGEIDNRYKNLFENSAVGMYQTTMEGKIIIANPAFLSMLKISSLDEAKQMSVPDELFIVPAAWEDYKNILLKEKEIKGLETSYRQKDGQVINVREYTRLIDLADGKQIIECSLEDVTDKRRVERTMLEAKELAERSDRLKSEFLAQMSHEVRTPINAILSFSTLLKEELYESLEEDLKQSFDIISSAGKRLIRTMDLFINMAQLRSGTYEFIHKEFDVYNDVLESVMQDYYSSLADKGLELIVEKECDENLISGDILSIKQIFSNLIDNAIKFTDNGYIKLSIKKNLEQNKITVEISDTGIGISEDYLENIFIPFSQEDQGYNRKYEGSGLGLALVKNFCDMNHAEIKVVSRKGEGSTFFIKFDLAA